MKENKRTYIDRNLETIKNRLTEKYPNKKFMDLNNYQQVKKSSDARIIPVIIGYQVIDHDKYFELIEKELQNESQKYKYFTFENIENYRLKKGAMEVDECNYLVFFGADAI